MRSLFVTCLAYILTGCSAFGVQCEIKDPSISPFGGSSREIPKEDVKEPIPEGLQEERFSNPR